MERDTDAVFKELTDGLEIEFRETALRERTGRERRRRRRQGLMVGGVLAVLCAGLGLYHPLAGVICFLGAILSVDRAYR